MEFQRLLLLNGAVRLVVSANYKNTNKNKLPLAIGPPVPITKSAAAAGGPEMGRRADKKKKVR